jgi:hypothetical protein
MCLNGITYCVKSKDIAKRLNCGYLLGPCGAQQAAACINTIPSTVTPQCDNCSGKLVSITLKYIGPSNQDINVTAKKCNVSLTDLMGANTGDQFTVNAADAGLLYLRKESYFSVGSFGQIKIPTNCCDNPVGKVFYPFEVIGWEDTDGNTCGDAQPGTGGDKSLSSTEALVDSDQLTLAEFSQYPNPASTNITLEFSTPTDEHVNLTIVNIQGKTVASIYNSSTVANQGYKFNHDITDLQSGIYLIHFETSKGLVQKKFVVLK